ncbi:PAS domain-containing protein [Alkalicaulis satelles]|uniref:histidine kinase n=1 Tax=Alkalicaulis satelles TaxID=2609175 RepID=A0A5M6ZK03_9PROT|nr:PAS domain-containing sensor histidine kinase [Alkalicaulis satelles]KAA5803997.1 PAS domain-containing protein [Alkalicaulis satelles]
MTDAEPIQLATLIVTGGAVAFAVSAGVWAFRMTAGARAARADWRAKMARLEDRLERAGGVLGAHPGLILVWDAPPDADAPDWGQPGIYGSPEALASMVQFADLGQGAAASGDAGREILDGIADFEARSARGDTVTLRQRLRRLMETGQGFSLKIAGPSGRLLEADGRAAGRQLVVWLTDATIRELEEAGLKGRVEEARRSADADPAACLDMAARSPVPAWRMNAAGRLVWVNDAYAEAVEAGSAADVVEDQILLEPALAEQTREALKAGSAQQSVRGAVAKGERRILAFHVYPVSGGVAGFAVDVTDGEEAKAALKRFRQAHDQTLNHMAEAVAIFDRAKRLVFYNQAFVRVFGLEEAMLNERPAHSALLDRLRTARRLPEQEDYARWKAAELALYESPPGADMPDELWALPDGRMLRVARQRHLMGGLLLIFEDMTDQLALQARYNTLIKVQRATLDKLHEAVAVFGSDGRLKLRNAAFETLWGLDPDGLDEAGFDDVSEGCMALYPNADAWKALKARITDPSPEARTPVAGEIRRTDQSVLTWLTRPLPDGATLIAWDDITDTRRVEAALRDRAEALQESEKIKTGFVEHVSYQLRTPLTTIHGYADLLAGGFAGELNERQSDHLTAIQQASSQLGKLIDDILDIAAIDAGQLELELGDVRLDALVTETAELIATRAEHAGVRIAIAADSELPTARADAKRLKQVLYNLLTNALDHIQPGGQVEIGAGAGEEDVTLWVSDDGAGIAAERQAHVFERFERGEGGGAGLGLALVNDIVRLHGGWVALESAPGEGTRVTCHLPLIADPAAAPPELALPARGRDEGQTA